MTHTAYDSDQRMPLVSTDAVGFVVRGVYSNGYEFWYTGKAGQQFMSSDYKQRFAYKSREAAENRAANINRMTALHGFHCIVESNEA